MKEKEEKERKEEKRVKAWPDVVGQIFTPHSGDGGRWSSVNFSHHGLYSKSLYQKQN